MAVGLALATVVLAVTATASQPVSPVEGEREGASEPDGPSVPELVSPAADAVSLTWEAPDGCPDVEAVRRALVGYLGTGPSAEAGAAVRAVARVSRSGGEYRLVLRTQTASGTSVRETTAADCMVIVDATAVIVAIAVDPATVLGRGDAAPKPVEPSEPEPEPVPSEPEPEPVPSEPEPVDPDEPAPFVAPETPAPEPEPQPGVRFGVRVGGGIDYGVLPGLAGGLRLAGAAFGELPGVGRLRRHAWRAELRGDFWFPRTRIVEEGIGGRVSLWSVGARGCWVPQVERVGLEFPLCAGLESGAMRGEPVGDRVTNPSPTQRFWIAADGSAGLAWVPRRFIAIVAQAELVVPLVRAGFRVGDSTVYRAGPPAVRGLVGVEARFR
jgi:hypothetical protein